MRKWSIAAGVLGLLVVSFAVPAQAAEITVLAGMGVISGVSDLAPAYEKLTGHKVVARFEQAAAMNEKINSGAQADIAAALPQHEPNAGFPQFEPDAGFPQRSNRGAGSTWAAWPR